MSEVDPSAVESLPAYVEDQLPQSPFEAVLTRIAVSTGDPDARLTLESFVESQKAPAYNESQKAEAPKPIVEYPVGSEPLERVKGHIIIEFFRAIRTEDSEAISLLIQNNLVTANTRSASGRTPLLEAVSTKIPHLVKELLDFGADPNAFGFSKSAQVTRTPLMLAASTGSLPIVKLLFEPPYSANDALVAPDGQIALRLASTAGHRAIVEYLPSRRAGGFLRWRTHNALAIARMKAALQLIASFIKFFIWDVPKFFVWSIPKHVVVLPVVRFCKWCWANRKKFGCWCKHQITEMPKRVVRAGKWVGRGVKKIPKVIKETGKEVWEVVKKVPKAIKETGKELWKFATQTLPRWMKNIALWLWDIITVRIPHAIVVVAKWIWSGISSLGEAAWDVIRKVASFLSTILQTIVTFLRNVTLKDIWNGFCDLLRAIFITLPRTLWSWIRRFGEVSYEIMSALFGCFGELVWWIFYVLKWAVFYIPSKLWVVLRSLASSLAKGLSELVVWFNPKL